MDTFKEKYSAEELKEITEWFTARMDKLPSRLRLNESTVSNDLQKTVRTILELTKRPDLDVCFSGYFAHLFLIRKKLMAMGME